MEPAIFTAELRIRLGIPEATADTWRLWPLQAGQLGLPLRRVEAHLQTAQCEAQGIVFVPMVAESTGTWDKGAAVVLKHIARAVAARTGG
ncbi:unnamed protein product, partial [Symbiodinium pilosum]